MHQMMSKHLTVNLLAFSEVGLWHFPVFLINIDADHDDHANAVPVCGVRG